MDEKRNQIDALPEAIVAVVKKENRVLLILRGSEVPGGGYWAPPSGKIEPKEEQAVAVAREVQEEVGLTVKPIRKVWENIAANGSHKLHWWLAECVSENFKLDSGEVADARWLTVEELLRLKNTFDGDRIFFRNVFPRL